jgi:hypothetical protein
MSGTGLQTHLCCPHGNWRTGNTRGVAGYHTTAFDLRRSFPPDSTLPADTNEQDLWEVERIDR